MKTFKLLSIFFLTVVLATSCSHHNDRIDEGITLGQLLGSYDLWYIDYNRTTGTVDIPFLSKAFTISFHNGNVIANNNIVGLGSVGNGYGDQIGYYDTVDDMLEVDHDVDGFYRLNVMQLTTNEIKIIDPQSNTAYFLIGYMKNDFDYNLVFFDNIEYFLQEYKAWEKTSTSGGSPNAFDNENFLQFTAENIRTFRSSGDNVGTDIDNINWDYIGGYDVYDVENVNDVKILTLDYDSNDNEEFELYVNNDNEIELYHIVSKTTYIFNGRGNIVYKKAKEKGNNNIKETRKRFKTDRKTVKRTIKSPRY
ncbi:MAG: hypothetical protein CSA39_05250 [Flavobacteriales bacterium]|nr:MAG: hypothetical protein CSA39_05250 [Flavobacteriales bacterium]